MCCCTSREDFYELKRLSCPAFNLFAWGSNSSEDARRRRRERERENRLIIGEQRERQELRLAILWARGAAEMVVDDIHEFATTQSSKDDESGNVNEIFEALEFHVKGDIVSDEEDYGVVVNEMNACNRPFF